MNSKKIISIFILVLIYRLNHAQGIIKQNDELKLSLESKSFSQSTIYDNKEISEEFCLVQLIERNSKNERLLWHKINFGNSKGVVDCDVVADFTYSKIDDKIYLIIAKRLYPIFYIYKIYPNVTIKEMPEIVNNNEEDPPLSDEEKEELRKMFTEALNVSQAEKQAFVDYDNSLFSGFNLNLKPIKTLSIVKIDENINVTINEGFEIDRQKLSYNETDGWKLLEE